MANGIRVSYFETDFLKRNKNTRLKAEFLTYLAVRNLIQCNTCNKNNSSSSPSL